MLMTARIQKIEDGVYEADYTIEPAEEVTPDSQYVRRFTTRAEARAWLEQQAGNREIAADEVVWIED